MRRSAPGTPARRGGAEFPTSTAPASASSWSIPATSSVTATFPTSRSHRSSRSSPTSRTGTASAAAMSSAIPMSRRRGRKIRASFFRGRRWPGDRLALPSPTRDLIDPFLDRRRLPARARALRLRCHGRAKGGDRLPAPFPAGPDRRHRRRRMPGEIALPVAAEAAIAHIRLARGPGGRGSRKRARGKSGLHGTTVPGNARRVSLRRAQGKCHRKHTACLWAGKVERVRQERTAGAATSPARKTPPGARPNRGGIWACSGSSPGLVA